jgi:probable rRNA maturation factor
VPNPRAEAAIALSHDAEVAVLNHMFRGIDKATNVLSFPAPPVRRQARLSNTALPPDERIFLGDIALSEETILREAAELGIPLHYHLQHLVVHGLLHLLHLDHDTDDNAARMERLETAILATICVPDPYAGSDPVVETGRDPTP